MGRSPCLLRICSLSQPDWEFRAAAIFPQPGLGGGLCPNYYGQVGQGDVGLGMDIPLLTQAYSPIRLGFSHYGLMGMGEAMTTLVYFQAMSCPWG